LFAPLIKPKPLSTSDVLQLEEQTPIRCTDQENQMRCAPLRHQLINHGFLLCKNIDKHKTSDNVKNKIK
jgi:hypothetical protein